MRTLSKIVCVAFATTLLFCNRPAEQRGPEGDTTVNPNNTLRPDNVIHADTLNRVDTTGNPNDTTRLPV